MVFQQVLCLSLLVLYCTTSTLANVPTSTTAENCRYEEVKKRRTPLTETETYMLHSDHSKEITSYISKNFDPESLANKNYKAVYSIYYNDNFIPVFKKIACENTSARDDFYCEQAIWETIIYWTQDKEVICEFTAKHDEKYGKFPELLRTEKDSVYLHEVPKLPRILNYFPKMLVEEKRVLRLPLTKLMAVELNEYRKCWIKLVEGHVHALNKFSELRVRFSNFFADSAI